MKVDAESLVGCLELLRAHGVNDLPRDVADELSRLRQQVQLVPDGGELMAGISSSGAPAAVDPPPQPAQGTQLVASLRGSLTPEMAGSTSAIGESATPASSTANSAAKKPPQRYTHRGRDFVVHSDLSNYPLALPPADRSKRLASCAAEVAGCQQCPKLVANRSQTVFGVGDPAARLCFFGEAPGADEDRMGEPFVGKAGQLLDRIIGACQLDRSDVYILNTVKCRPPMNRNPEPQEQENCWGFAEQQLAIIQPEIIVCLGAVAAKKLLNTDASMGMLRQQFFQYRGSRVAATYHPAYLLRNPSAKAEVWDDMKMVMAALGSPVG